MNDMQTTEPLTNNIPVQNEVHHEEISEHHTYRMVVVTVVVMLLGITIYFINSRMNIFNALTNGKGISNTFTKIKGNGISNPEPFNPKKSWVEITSDSPKAPLNNELTLTIKGFSEGKDINGYDILFASSSTDFDILSAESLLPNFQIFQFKKKDHITITSVKSLNAQGQTILNATPFLKIKVQPKKKSTITFTILPISGREKTKFVDSKVQPQTPQVKSVQVAIE